MSCLLGTAQCLIWPFLWPFLQYNFWIIVGAFWINTGCPNKFQTWPCTLTEGIWLIPHFLDIAEDWISRHDFLGTQGIWGILQIPLFSVSVETFQKLISQVPNKNMIDAPLIPPCVIIEYPIWKYFWIPQVPEFLY